MFFQMDEIDGNFKKDDGNTLASSDTLDNIKLVDRYVGTVTGTDEDGDRLAWSMEGSPVREFMEATLIIRLIHMVVSAFTLPRPDASPPPLS